MSVKSRSGKKASDGDFGAWLVRVFDRRVSISDAWGEPPDSPDQPGFEKIQISRVTRLFENADTVIGPLRRLAVVCVDRLVPSELLLPANAGVLPESYPAGCHFRKWER